MASTPITELVKEKTTLGSGHQDGMNDQLDQLTDEQRKILKERPPYDKESPLKNLPITLKEVLSANNAVTKSSNPEQPALLGKSISNYFQAVNSAANPSYDQPARLGASGAARIAKDNLVSEGLRDVEKAATGSFGGLMSGLVANTVTGGLSSLISSGLSYASTVHRDNTLKAMRDQDYAAARSVGLTSPEQLQQVYATNNNGRPVNTYHTPYNTVFNP